MVKGNTIFNKSGDFSNEVLQRYLQGKASAGERLAIEQRMVDDPMFNEAVEGLQDHDVHLAGLTALTHKFEANLSVQISKPPGAIAGVHSFMIITSIITLSILAGIGYVHQQTSNPIPKGSDGVKQDTFMSRTISESEKTIISDETEIEEEIEEELKIARIVTKEEQISYEQTVEDQSQPMNKNITDNTTNNTPDLKTVKIDITPTPLTKPKAVNTPLIVYIHNLKVILLPKAREKTVKIRNIEAVSGTRVYSAEKIRTQGNPANDIIGPYKEIAYIDYLENALRQFENEKYKKALKSLKVILDQHPADINAYFYGALCYYNLGKPDKAIAYFDLVMNDPRMEFDPEASFYRAKTYILAGQREKARRLFEQIIQNEGFYTSRAQEALDEL